MIQTLDARQLTTECFAIGSEGHDAGGDGHGGPLIDPGEALLGQMNEQGDVHAVAGGLHGAHVKILWQFLHVVLDWLRLVHAHKQATGRQEPRRGDLYNGKEDYEEPFGLLGAPAQHASAAARHMHEFGTTSEQLAAIAVACRKHAALNPAAQMRTPITIEDVLNSRWIVKPFHLLDCCLVSDGGGAVIVTSAERARDLLRRPVYVLGFGTGHRPDMLESPSLTTLGGARSSAQAYRMAGLEPRDMQFAEIYDCFTGIVLITLEDYGFCAKGEGGPFVEDGRIELGGQLPVNTHGGLLSQAHVEGMLHITEAVKQLRGGEVEPERQVPDARLGIVSGHGANLSAHATLILSNEPG